MPSLGDTGVLSDAATDRSRGAIQSRTRPHLLGDGRRRAGKAQDLRSLNLEAIELAVVLMPIVKPGDGPVIPLAGLLRLSQPGVDHRQEEPVEGVSVVFAELHRLVHGMIGSFPVADPDVGCSQGVPVRSFIGCELDGPLGKSYGLVRVAEAEVLAGRRESRPGY